VHPVHRVKLVVAATPAVKVLLARPVVQAQSASLGPRALQDPPASVHRVLVE